MRFSGEPGPIPKLKSDNVWIVAAFIIKSFEDDLS
jgi:hypothetical protein